MPRIDSEARRQPLNIRTTVPIRQKLEALARANGQTLTQEIESLIEKAAEQNEVFGGPELRRVAYAMATAFALSGQRSAGPDVPPREWLHSPTAGITAMAAVVDTLTVLLGLDEQAIRQAINVIAGRLETRIATEIKR
jgi:hypothetical protein